MKKIFTTLALGALLATTFQSAAQDTSTSLNYLEGKNPLEMIYPLDGEWLNWTNDNGATHQAGIDDYSNIFNTTSTIDVFLFPGGYNTEKNMSTPQIQCFYIDLGEEVQIGKIVTRWETASAKAFDIYVMDVEPNSENLDNAIEKRPYLNKDEMPNNPTITSEFEAETKGRYVVLKATNAENWDWGIKLWSIAIYPTVDDIQLNSLSITPPFLALEQPTQLNFIIKDLVDQEIPFENVKVEVSSNAMLTDKTITVNSGNKVVITVSYKDISKSITLNVVPQPNTPNTEDVYYPVYTETCNNTAIYNTVYEGGAVKETELYFNNGSVGQIFTSTRCVYFSNSSLGNDVLNIALTPAEKGFGNLKIDVYSQKSVPCWIEFEQENPKFPFTLNGEEWNTLNIPLEKVGTMKVMSIRFADENINDIVLSNIYFTQAPELSWDNVPADTKTKHTSTNVVPIFSSHYGIMEQPVFSGHGSVKVINTVYIPDEDIQPEPISTRAGEDESYTYKAMLFENQDYQNPTTITLGTNGEGIDVTNAKVFVIDIYAQTTGTITVNALWKYGSVVNTESYDFKIDTDDVGSYHYFNIYASDIGYTQQLTTIQSLSFTSNIPTFAVDNCYFAGSIPLAVEAVGAEAETVNVYNMQGICVKSGVAAENALSELPAGLYIVGGKKVLVK